MHIIFSNEPLLFVHGPPVFIRVDIPISDEESTSVFTLTEEGQAEKSIVEVDEVDEVGLVVNPSVAKRIAYLGGAFQKEVYRPLQFLIGNISVEGAIDKIEGDMVFIRLNGEEKDIVAIEMKKIEEISWRGEPFVDN